VAVHGVLVEGDEEIEAVSHVGDGVGTGADGEEGVTAANDGLIGVIGVEVKATAAEDFCEDITWSGDALACRTSDCNGEKIASSIIPCGLHLNAYNAYHQSIIRAVTPSSPSAPVPTPSPTWETASISSSPSTRTPWTATSASSLLAPPASTTPTRSTPAPPRPGVQLCPIPVSKLADITRNKVAQTRLAMGAALSMMGVGFPALESVIVEQFRKKEQAVIDENVSVAAPATDYRHGKLQTLRLAPPHDREQIRRPQRATALWQWEAPPPASNSTVPIL